MVDTKVSAAADPITLVASDKVPIARSGSTVSYAATMAEVAAFAGSTAAGVTSFNTRTGAVTLSSADVTGAGGAPLASPTFTGTPNLPSGTVGVTQTAGNNTTALATTAFVTTALTSYAPLAAPVFTGDARAATPAYGDNDTSIATTAFVQSAVTPLYDNVGRNRLHNSRFTINQRGYTTGTALAAGAYGFDRWKAGASGCTLTFTASPPSTTVTIIAGSLQQIVEALSVDGGTYTLSWTGTAQGRVNAGTYATSPLTVTGLSSNTAITVEFNTGTLAGVQLEQGSVATPLEKPDPQQDLAKCQRFFQAGLLWGQVNLPAAGAGYGVGANLLVQMRGTPSVAISSNTCTNLNTVSVAMQSINTIVAIGYVATGAAQCTMNIGYTASADL